MKNVFIIILSIFCCLTATNTAMAQIITIDGNKEVCYGTHTTLTASASGVTDPVFRWYASQEPTVTPFFTGPTYTTTDLVADTTFYVSVEGDNLPENAPGVGLSLLFRSTLRPPSTARTR